MKLWRTRSEKKQEEESVLLTSRVFKSATLDDCGIMRWPKQFDYKPHVKLSQADYFENSWWHSKSEFDGKP